MSKHLDLRCSRRLTVNEGRLILDALDSAGANAKPLRAKILAAITLATHECPPEGRCAVCGQHGEQVSRMRERRAKDFQESLRNSEAAMAMARTRAREHALRSPAHLKLAGTAREGR